MNIPVYASLKHVHFLFLQNGIIGCLNVADPFHLRWTFGLTVPRGKGGRKSIIQLSASGAHLPFSVLRSHARRRLSSGHCMKTRQRTLPVLLLNRERWSHRHNHSMRASLRSLALSVAFASLGPFPHISALWRPSCPSGLWFEVALHESERECLTDEAMKQ